MEYKYTTDGRKVIIIGDLNQSEKIVQEIFVTKDGDEIPSGERFVVKSLHDSPIKSWKENELEKLETRFNNEQKEWNSRIKRICEEKVLIYKSLECRVKWLKQVAKQPHPESLKKVIETLALFLSNSDIWVFYSDYSNWYLEKYDQEGISRIHDYVNNDYHRTTLDDMKLISLFGRSNGDFQFGISQYSDGSGSSKDVEYFKSEKDARYYIQNRFNSIESYNESYINIAEKFNLKLDDNKLTAFIEWSKQSILKDIKNSEQNLVNSKSRLADLEIKLKKLKRS